MTPPLALGGGPGRLPGPGAKKAGEKEGTNCEAAGGANVRASASHCGFTALLACGSSPSSCGSSVVWAALTQAHHSLPPSPRRSVRFQSDPWVGSARPLHGFLQVLLWSRQLGWSTELPLPGVGADAPESLRGFESSLLSHTWTHHFKVQELFAASPLPPLPPSSWFCASTAQLPAVPRLPYASSCHRAFAYVAPAAWPLPHPLSHWLSARYSYSAFCSQLHLPRCLE